MSYSLRNFIAIGIMATVFIIALKAALRFVPVPQPFKGYIESV